MLRRGFAVLALVASGSAARADVPDASLRAVVERPVRLELDGGEVAEGRMLAFEAGTVTIARTGTSEVATFERARLQRIISLGPPLRRERLRVLGVQSSLLGTLVVDADYKRFRAFASGNILFPLLTASGSGATWFSGAVGAGVTFPLGRRWKLDVLAQTLPLRTTSFYTYLAFGLGAGIHYTNNAGLTITMSFPVIGFATRIGSSPTGYDASFRYNDSLQYYYLAGLAGMPLLTVGYRFGTNCRRPD